MSSPASLSPLLQLRKLTKKFGIVTAVRNADLEIYSGDFVVIFGPNGAGKTTLLRMIASLTRPSSGELTFFPNRSDRTREQVGYLSHESLLYNEMTGLENLVFYARLYHLPDLESRCRSMLEKIGLAEVRHRLVRNYSRGMKQRLTLARALLHEPQLLLLDEPYTGLDPQGSRLLTDVLGRLKKQGRTVLLITHNLAQGLALCSRIIIQHRGEFVFQAAGQEVQTTDFERLYVRMVEC
jgi:heme exporter protein A